MVINNSPKNGMKHSNIQRADLRVGSYVTKSNGGYRVAFCGLLHYIVFSHLLFLISVFL